MDQPLTLEAILRAVNQLQEQRKNFQPMTFEESMALQPWAIQLTWAKIQRDNLVRAVWDWIISVNNGSGLDADDLIAALEQLGAPCPADLEEN